MSRDSDRRAELERELAAEPGEYNPARAEPWMDDALCAQVDPEIFFPDKGDSAKTARKICGACTVREDCEDFAERQTDLYGMLAGKTAHERRKERSVRAAARESLGEPAPIRRQNVRA